jgi:hypothetical protein
MSKKCCKKYKKTGKYCSNCPRIKDEDKKSKDKKSKDKKNKKNKYKKKK